MIKLARTALVLVSAFSALSVGCAVSADDPAPQADEVEETAQALKYTNGYPRCTSRDDAMRNAVRQCGALKVVNLQPIPSAGGACATYRNGTVEYSYKVWGYDCK